MRTLIMLFLSIMVATVIVSTATSQEGKEDKATAKVAGTFIVPKEMDSLAGRKQMFSLPCPARLSFFPGP